MAARALTHQLVNRVCSDNPKTIRVKKTLLVIGLDVCPKNEVGCFPAYVKSCELLKEDSLSLTDPYFLKVLGRETIDVVFRVAASSMENATYEAYGLNQLATTAFDLGVSLINDEPVGPTVATALDDLARMVGKQYSKQTLSLLQDSGKAL